MQPRTATAEPTGRSDARGEARSDARSNSLTARLTALWETPRTWAGWLATVDHKTLGKRYIYTALAFFVLGGLEASVMRAQLARPKTGSCRQTRTTNFCSRAFSITRASQSDTRRTPDGSTTRRCRTARTIRASTSTSTRLACCSSASRPRRRVQLDRDDPPSSRARHVARLHAAVRSSTAAQSS